MIMKTTGTAPTKKLPVWDFVVHRADGAAIRLHPEWSKPKFPSFAAEGHETAVAVPNKGFGKSDGRGTYASYKALGNQQTLFFQTGL